MADCGIFSGLPQANAFRCSEVIAAYYYAAIIGLSHMRAFDSLSAEVQHSPPFIAFPNRISYLASCPSYSRIRISSDSSIKKSISLPS